MRSGWPVRTAAFVTTDLPELFSPTPSPETSIRCEAATLPRVMTVSERTFFWTGAVRTLGAAGACPRPPGPET